MRPPLITVLSEILILPKKVSALLHLPACPSLWQPDDGADKLCSRCNSCGAFAEAIAVELHDAIQSSVVLRLHGVHMHGVLLSCGELRGGTVSRRPFTVACDQDIRARSAPTLRRWLCSVRFAISVEATPLSVVHYTVDLDNASCGLTLSCQRACYAGRMLMNQPTPGTIKPGMSAIARKKCALLHARNGGRS